MASGPKYKPRGLQRLLDQYFESDPLLDHSLTAVIIPAFDTKIQQPVFFSSWQVCDQLWSIIACNNHVNYQQSLNDCT